MKVSVMECAHTSLSPDGFTVGGEGWGEGAASRSVCNVAPERGAAPSPNPLPQRKSRWGRGLSRAAVFIGVFALCTLAHAIDPLAFKDRAQEIRFQNLTRQLRCLVCQNQDLGDSDADLAKDLRRQVFEQMQAGKSDDEIKQYLVARYNDFVLYDPPLKAGTALLWFAPGAFVLIGGITLALVLRKRTRAHAAVTDIDSGEDW